MNRIQTTHLTAVALAVFALSASGCSDRTLPTSVERPSFAATSSGGGLQLVSNSVRYSDTGVQLGTGRSGSAAIEVNATYQGGVTTLVVSSCPAAAGAACAASDGSRIDKLQIKVYDASGRLLTTLNFTTVVTTPSDRWTAPFPSSVIPEGARVVVQANVTGVDPRRTDVVTASATQAVRPMDLAIYYMSMQPEVQQGRPVPVYATLTEMSGVRSGQCDVILTVDGTERDRANGVYVDAGGSVTVDMLITGTVTQGLILASHTVTVTLTNFTAEDAYAPNNTRSMPLTVVAPGTPVVIPPMTFFGTAADVTIRFMDSTRVKNWFSWAAGTTPPTDFNNPVPAPDADNLTYYSESGRSQDVTLHANFNGSAIFPLDQLALKVGFLATSTTDYGQMQVMHSFSGTRLASNANGSSVGSQCLVGGAGGVLYTLCYYPSPVDPYFTLDYSFHATAATYISQQFDFTSLDGSCRREPGTRVSSVDQAISAGYDCYIANWTTGDQLWPFTGNYAVAYDVTLVTAGIQHHIELTLPLKPTASGAILEDRGVFTVIPAPSGCTLFGGVPCPGRAVWTYTQGGTVLSGLGLAAPVSGSVEGVYVGTTN